VAEHEHRPSLDLGDEWEQIGWRRSRDSQSQAAWKAVGTGDFNGDGHFDILWQNASSGQVSIWQMNANTVIGGGAVSANPGPSWRAVGTGDFNNDGHSDILFQMR
jgi:hypothetical protein